MISGLRRGVDEICVLLAYYAVSSDNPSPTFRLKFSVPPSRIQKPLTLKEGTDTFSETSVKDCHSTLRNIPEDGRSYLSVC
jgi:hypothetical protein